MLPAVSLVALFAVVSVEPPSGEVVIHHDIRYRDDVDADKERQSLDVYLPKEGKGHPVLFFIHGGAWRIGSKGTFAEPAKRLAERGVVVVCPNYRFSPKVQHPAHVEDVAKAFAWTVDHAAEYGGDAKKVVIGGHSAGGHLAALLATNETYLKAEKRSAADVRGVVGVSGVYQIDHRVKLFHPIFSDDEKTCETASPIKHVSADRPPMLLVYADSDFAGLPAGAEAFAKELVKGKNDAVAKEFTGKSHITIMTGMGKADDPVLRATLAFVRERTK